MNAKRLGAFIAERRKELGLAIRLYMENGLVHPHMEEGLYKNSYTFTEDNIRELEEVAVLRKAGFSIFEISLMREMPEKLPEILEKKKMSVEKRASRLPNRGVGTVISVMEEHGFHAAFSNAGSGSAGTKEPGIGGIWKIVFMLWNEIRPDCWFPVILYRNEGESEKKSATLLYGSFKGVWHIGDEVAVSWNDNEPAVVYPLENGWILKKIHFYFALAVFSMLGCVVFLHI